MVKVGDKIEILEDCPLRAMVSKGELCTVEKIEGQRFYFRSAAGLWTGSLDSSFSDFYKLVVKTESKQNEALRKGDKFDSGKPMIRFLTSEFLEQTALAQTYGAKKYGPWNFQKGLETTALYDAAMRHLMTWMSGEDLDKESGNTHLGHAAANLNMLIWTLANKPEMDDRPKREEK